MKKKYLILIIIILLLLLVGGYLGYKIYYANYYDLSNIQDFEKSKENFVIKDDTITITTNKLSEEEYLIFKNMKMRNIFSDFEKRFSSEENPNIKIEEFVWYYLKDSETGKQIAAIGIAKGRTLVEDYKSDIQELSSTDNRVKSKDRTKLFKDNNITNDIELINYLIKTADKKNSIFDSLEDMKNKYTIHSLVRGTYMNVEGITLIEGDYQGYMFNHNLNGTYAKEFNILKDNKRYTLTFIGLDYFTEEKIQDLLNTLVIE